MRKPTKRMARATIYIDEEVLREFRNECAIHGISVSKAVRRLIELITKGEWYNELDRVTEDCLPRTEQVTG